MLAQLALGFQTPGLAPVQHARASAVMETKAELVKLANSLNPVVGYWDPLKLADRNFWGKGEEATIGFLRKSEIKHGRIAMAGFVGFIVHTNGIRTQGDGIVAAVPKGLSAPETWDALPEIAKWQIILFAGLMEIFGEAAPRIDGTPHYMRGAPCSTRARSAHAAAAPITTPVRL